MKKYFVHSTTPDGLSELLQGQRKQDGSTLSTSSYGCEKYINKGGCTIFVEIECDSEDISSEDWGDIGWAGGTPRKTTYDEIRVTNYKVTKLLVPPYLKESLYATGMAAVGQMVAEDFEEKYLNIEGYDQLVMCRVQKVLDGFWNDGYEDPQITCEYYEAIEEAFSY